MPGETETMLELVQENGALIREQIRLQKALGETLGENPSGAHVKDVLEPRLATLTARFHTAIARLRELRNGL